MASVIGDPTDRPTLERHRTAGDHHDLEGPAGGERLVGQQPMEADRHAVAGEEVERDREEHISQTDAAAPQTDDPHREGEERNADDQGGDQTAGAIGQPFVVVERPAGAMGQPFVVVERAHGRGW